MASFADAAATFGRIAVAANHGAEEASNEMADVFRRDVRAVLTARSHAFATKTPSSPGEPPAMISGQLAGSMDNTPALETGDGEWTSQSGPTERYSRIQELGGPMTGHPLMHWREDGIPHWSARHDLPARPYMKPVSESPETGAAMTEEAARILGAAIGSAV